MPLHEDIRAIKRAHPIEDVISSYGVELRRSGRGYTGRCPFHPDHGRPNLSVCCAADPADSFFLCFRCGTAGDVIRFVERLTGVGFAEAVERLGRPAALPSARTARRTAARFSGRPWGDAERACLGAAITLYHNILLDNLPALEYLRSRGIQRDIIERCRLGYAPGGQLASYVQWKGLPLGAAARVGLLQRGGAETFAGRIIVPELRGGRPIWLIGRVLGDADGPKYLGLPGRGRKPLLGWETVAGQHSAIVVESAFDYLTLVGWGFGALALLGTRVRARVVDALRAFDRLYLALNSDDAGRDAAAVLAESLGARAVVVELPGVKDVSELAAERDGRELFLSALQRSQRAAA